MTHTQVLAEIKNVIHSQMGDAEVMLFGSRAKESHSDDSDYDILIITSNTLHPDQKIPIRTSIRKELLKKGIRSDILIQSKSEIEKKKKLPGHFIRNIMKDSILL
jgi:predicted nucleotidyltransferase